MDLVLLLILMSSIVVLVRMERTRGCFMPADISCSDTTLSCDNNQVIDLQNIEVIGTCKKKDTCVKIKDDKKEFFQFTLKDVISIYKQCSSQHSCTIVSPHGVNGNDVDYDHMMYTYRCMKEVTTTSTTASATTVTTLNNTFNSTLPSTTVNTTNTHIYDNDSSTGARKEMDYNNSSTGAIKDTDGDNSKTDTIKETITTVVVTVTVVIVVEVVVVLIVILIYRKRRVKHALNTDRVMTTGKTTDAYDEITNFNGYETAVDPGLRTTLSSDQPITTSAGRGYNTLIGANDLAETIEVKSDLKASDTYDHIGENNPTHKDKNQFNTPVQDPSVPLTTLTNYENINLAEDYNIKDDGTYYHLYSDNNNTKTDAGVTRHIDGANVTTNLNDDDTYNHLHDTPAHEKPDVSLDIMEDNSHTRSDAMNDEDNNTYNHLHEG